MTTTTDRPEQLALLTPAEVPVLFRLDEATRRRGLAHIAEIRVRLDEARERRQATVIGRRREATSLGRPTTGSTRPKAA